MFGIGFHQTCGFVAKVVFVGCSIGIPGLAHDEDVLAQPYGIGVHGNWSDVDIGIVTGGLTRRGAVEIPFWEIINALGSLAQSLEIAKSVSKMVPRVRSI